MRKITGLMIGLLAALTATTALNGCSSTQISSQKSTISSYGVFLSLDNSNLSAFAGYKTVVIDAQYFTAEDIAALKANGQTIYSYLNIGSIENFRDYYNEFLDMTLGDYENWDEERWVDVADARWQDFVVETLAAGLAEKGVDGFFIDNCDVYYYRQTDAIFEGVAGILQRLTHFGLAVVINGGDTFVDRYYDEQGRVSDILTGINQESVFSTIDFDGGTLGVASAQDHAYYLDYLQRYDELGAKIFLLEYTTDAAMSQTIDRFCQAAGWQYYISDSIELDG